MKAKTLGHILRIPSVSLYAFCVHWDFPVTSLGLVLGDPPCVLVGRVHSCPWKVRECFAWCVPISECWSREGADESLAETGLTRLPFSERQPSCLPHTREDCAPQVLVFLVNTALYHHTLAVHVPNNASFFKICSPRHIVTLLFFVLCVCLRDLFTCVYFESCCDAVF